MKNIFIVILALAALSACAEKWSKPGARPQEFDAMRANCTSNAYARFPVASQPVPIGQGYMTPVQGNCVNSAYGVNCFQTGGEYVPPQVVMVDNNDHPRSEAIRACFYSNGWQPAQD